jgi:hypothetical protein
VRVFLLMFGMFIAALAFSAAPASAHAHHDGDAALTQDADGRADSHHGGQADHDVDHNAADHSHPIGEDTYHEKASHSSLDFAHHQTVVVKVIGLARAANLPVADDAACGLALTPPTRPPLG